MLLLLPMRRPLLLRSTAASLSRTRSDADLSWCGEPIRGGCSRNWGHLSAQLALPRRERLLLVCVRAFWWLLQLPMMKGPPIGQQATARQDNRFQLRRTHCKG